jgi:hypothetical protein
MRTTMPIAFARFKCRRLLLVLALLLLPLPVRGYVLMGEHVLDRMATALGSSAALSATQTLTLHRAPPPLPSPVTMTETVRLQQPDLFRADAIGGPHTRRILFAGGTALMAVDGVLQPDRPPGYTRYHDLLILKSRKALTAYLRRLGIDVGVSSLGRWEDDYCYVVGARFPDEEAPQLWVSKDTFLPVRLLLPPATGITGSQPVEIRYRNWTVVDGTAFPMHVVCLANHQIMQEIRVDRVAVAPGWSDAPFDPLVFRRESAAPPAADEARGPFPAGRILLPSAE